MSFAWSFVIAAVIVTAVLAWIEHRNEHDDADRDAPNMQRWREYGRHVKGGP